MLIFERFPAEVETENIISAQRRAERDQKWVCVLKGPRNALLIPFDTQTHFFSSFNKRREERGIMQNAGDPWRTTGDALELTTNGYGVSFFV